MKIVTWNINGIRALSKPLKIVLDSLEADIICLQETKITRDQQDEQSHIVEGYNSYFSYCKTRNGYSGTAIFAKNHCIPEAAEEGLSNIFTDLNCNDVIGFYDNTNFSDNELKKIDNEGRTVMTKYSFLDGNITKKLVIINVYCPRADEKEDRKLVKLQFYKLLEARVRKLLQNGNHILIVGDYNTSHRKIDNCNSEAFDLGTHPDREWLDNFLSNDFVDLFRLNHPNEIESFTCWRTLTGARNTNYGTRIDYIVSNTNLIRFNIDCYHLTEFEGSDHCPVIAEFNFSLISAKKYPSLCSKYFPEFLGKQQKIYKYGFSLKRTCTSETFNNIPNKKQLIKNQKEIFTQKSHLGNLSDAWKTIFKPPSIAPKCSGHTESSVLRTVKKEGINKGKQFYVCNRPEGAKGNKEARCDFFMWKN